MKKLLLKQVSVQCKTSRDRLVEIVFLANEIRSARQFVFQKKAMAKSQFATFSTKCNSAFMLAKNTGPAVQKCRRFSFKI